MLYVATETIATTPQVGAKSDGRTGEAIKAVHSPLHTTLTLLRDEDQAVAQRQHAVDDAAHARLRPIAQRREIGHGPGAAERSG